MSATEVLEAVQTMETANLVQLIGTGVTLLIAIGSGAFAIVSGLWSFFSAKKLNEQSEELQEKLNKLASLNDQITYIRNNQFDYKFKICQDLSETSFAMCHYFCVYVMCGLLGTSEEKENEKQYYEIAEKACYEYRDMVFKYAPFIPKELYEKFDELLSLGFAFLKTVAGTKQPMDIIAKIKKDYLAVESNHQQLTVDLRSYLEGLARGDINA